MENTSDKSRLQITAEASVEVTLKLIEKAMDEQGKGVLDLAVGADVPRATVYSWLNREAVMSIEKLFRVMEYLGLQVVFQPIVEKK